MLKGLFELATQLVFITKDTERNPADIKQLKTEVKALEQEVRELSSAVQRLDMELKHFREIERYERQQLASALERTLLHFERRLPPPTRED